MINLADKINTLSDYYALMRYSGEVRRRAVIKILANDVQNREETEVLKNTLDRILLLPETDGRYKICASGFELQADLSYEIEELKRDISYLAGGEEALYSLLEDKYPKIHHKAKKTERALAGRKYNLFVTDRDGTVNNYCGRYNSSIQSAYNAVFLSKFMQNCTENSCILTSASLENIGIIEMSVMPAGTCIYAGSKGREYKSKDGSSHRFPLTPQEEKIIKKLNQGLSELISLDNNNIFSCIGSGLQLKFGEVTAAYQDIYGSVPTAYSEKYRLSVEALVDSIDPSGEYFSIEDTGMDLEIIPKTGPGKKDFDKADGFAFVSSELNLNPKKGPNLVCGDTQSDLKMVNKSMDYTEDTYAVFVTREDHLVYKTRSACPNSFIADSPDELIITLNNLSKMERII